LGDTPVVCVLGPRQCGKTTLARALAGSATFLSLDEAALCSTARHDPDGFIASLSGPAILDEIQRVPELLPAIKAAVDRDRRPGRFLLTGSANLLLLPTVHESLAGRMEVLSLHPLTEAEKERHAGRFLARLLQGGFSPAIAPADPEALADLPRRLVAGGFPEPLLRSPERARQWHRQYLRSLLDRDIRDVARSARRVQWPGCWSCSLCERPSWSMSAGWGTTSICGVKRWSTTWRCWSGCFSSGVCRRGSATRRSG
jgi:predicted AAA+ superfamily ATPase